MTVVAIWLEREVEGTSLWSIADTRISQKGPTGGTTIMTDTGAKLFAIPIRCHQGSVRQAARYSTSIGFAFAGSVLPATMTVATASTFLQNLLTDTFRSP